MTLRHIHIQVERHSLLQLLCRGHSYAASYNQKPTYASSEFLEYQRFLVVFDGEGMTNGWNGERGPKEAMSG